MAAPVRQPDLFTADPASGVQDASMLCGRDLVERQRASSCQELRSAGRSGDLQLLTRLLSRGADCSSPADLAARLLARFGDVRRTVSADGAELAAAAGVAAARELRLSYELALSVLEQPLRERDVIASWEGLKRYLVAALSGRTREAFHVLFLDGANRLIADERMGEGTTNAAPVYPREVVRRALEYGASNLILVHNHPSGTDHPSQADREITKQIVAAAKSLGIAVHDHVLVAGEQLVSFRSHGLM
jgi:DNA repair protein RadC